MSRLVDLWLQHWPPQRHLHLPPTSQLRAWRQALRGDLEVEGHPDLGLASLSCQVAGHPFSSSLRAVLRREAHEMMLPLLRQVPSLRRLAAQGWDLLLLKGGALVLGGHVPAGARPMLDLDLLVQPQHFAPALEVLLSQGWRADTPLPRAFPGDLLCADHSVDLVHPAGGALDLHFASLHESRRPGMDEGLWTRSREVSFQGVWLRIPSSTDLLFQVCVHGCRRGGSPARWVEDATRLLYADVAPDWSLLLAEADLRRLALPLWASLDYLRQQGLPVPAEFLQRLRALVREPWELLDFWVRSAWSGHHPLRRSLLTWLDYHRLRQQGVTVAGGWPGYLWRRWDKTGTFSGCHSSPRPI